MAKLTEAEKKKLAAAKKRRAAAGTRVGKQPGVKKTKKKVLGTGSNRPGRNAKSGR